MPEPLPAERVAIEGLVIDDTPVAVRVCLDWNLNGRCDGTDPQALTDSNGRYRLEIPPGTTKPLLAEIEAGRSRDAAGATATAWYRLASPAPGYTTVLTPLTTMVQLVGLRDLPLAEDLARAELGLPPRHPLKLDTAPAPGTTTHAVMIATALALQAAGDAVNLQSPTGLAAVAAEFPPALRELPQLRIVTQGGAPITSKEVYVDATFTLTRLARPGVADVVNGRIRGRGNSTWGLPKNPYKVQFSNDASYARLADVLGMAKNRNWALLADWYDRSLMRNLLVYSLGNSSAFADGLKWTPSGQHLEVWLNDDYVGVYLLTEDIRIDPARLPLHKMSTNPAAADIDGGYIAEVDARLDCYKGDDLNLQVVTPAGVPICIDTPDESAITPRQLAYIKDELLRVEADLYGARRLDGIHAPSFVDWYLVQELLRNADAAFYSSDFLWKDGSSAADPSDRLLHMGPLWDFDLSAGNVATNDNWQTDGCWVSKPYEPNWYVELFRSPDFLALTMSRWQGKRARIAGFIDGAIGAYSRRLQAAQARNFGRWPIEMEPRVSHYRFQSHAEEVDFLRQFLLSRVQWLDLAFQSSVSFDALCR
ncbi:MAG: CotH kinase family protein [Betaproteobacteria bacterium]